MSEHFEKEPRTKLILLIDILLTLSIIILALIVFHPFGIGENIYLPDDEIVVAAMLPLKGPLKEFGSGYKDGIEMAVEDINAEGGIRGVPLRIHYFDNDGDADISISQIHEIHEMGIPVLIGAIASSNSMAIAPYAEELKIVMLSPGSTTSELTGFSDYVYRTVSSDIYQGAGMAKIIASNSDLDTVMIIYQNNLYGKSLRHALLEELEHGATQIRIVSEISIEEEGHVDTEFIVHEMNETKPHAVVLMIYPEQGISIMNAAKDAGLNPAWFGSDTMTSSEVPQGVGSYSEEMIGFIQAHKLTVPSFEEKYYARKGAPAKLDFPVTYGYDAVILLAECIKDGGYTADGIRNALNNIRHIGICGPRVFDENGDVQPAYDVMIVREGEWQPLKWNQILRYERKTEDFEDSMHE